MDSCHFSPNYSFTPEQKEMYQNPEVVQKILRETKTIAVVGLSPRETKASYQVAAYMQAAGYRIIPVNPNADYVLGEKSYPNLTSVPEPIDLVDIFRSPIDCDPVIDEAIAIKAPAVWLQLKIINFGAVERARQAGLLTVMDLCPKMEHEHYYGGLEKTNAQL